MEDTAILLRRLARQLDEPGDYWKLIRIALELHNCSASLIAEAVKVYCHSQDDLFVRKLKSGRPAEGGG